MITSSILTTITYYKLVIVDSNIVDKALSYSFITILYLLSC